MVTLSACIEMLFTNLPFIERIDAAAAAGAQAVEFWGIDGKDLPGIFARARALGLAVGTFACGVPLTDPAKGEQAEAGLRRAIGAAAEQGLRDVIVTTGNRLEGLAVEEQEASVVRALRSVATEAEAAGVRLNLELLNTLVDHRGYFLDETVTAVRIVERVASASVKVLYDIYHMQIMEGNLIATIRKYIDHIGYFHAADVPGRFEPGTGEINYRNVVSAIADAGYTGFIGLEFRPQGGAERSGDALRQALAAMRG